MQLCRHLSPKFLMPTTVKKKRKRPMRDMRLMVRVVRWNTVDMISLIAFQYLCTGVYGKW